MSSVVASNLLIRNESLLEVERSKAAVRGRTLSFSRPRKVLDKREQFLRIPPFPGAKVRDFVRCSACDTQSRHLANELARQRVGGSYWARQPALPENRILVRSPNMIRAAAGLGTGHKIVLWTADSHRPSFADVEVVRGECDPWYMVAGARSVIVEQDGDDVRLIARLSGVDTFLFDPQTGSVALDTASVEELLERRLGREGFVSPFTGQIMGAAEAIDLCSHWRRLIDSNRDIAGGLGFAFWKQDHIAPLLWGGSEPFRFVRTVPEAQVGRAFAVWRAKAPKDAASQLERLGSSLIEVEDGFVRSRGLGADCIPPMSITVDRLGAYFDPAQESELERLLEHEEVGEELLARAAQIRSRIVAAGLGKYGRGRTKLERRADGRRHILVPGQVEDDRAVISGGCGLVSNFELLKCVRANAPDAYIIYKPHPDVVAGHRRGAVPQASCLEFADEIVGDEAVSSLIDMVDEIHVNTSLAGFEALLRLKPVTTYGVPFYAGWGLTRDLGPVPARRARARSLDELVAVTLLLYPRYLDPVSGLPCPAEVVVSRLTAEGREDVGLLVSMRRLQGKLLRGLRRLGQ